MQLVIFKDVEQVLIDYLTPQLAANGYPVHVGVSIPKSRPEEFVQVYRTGGPSASMVTDSPQVTVDSWAVRGSRAIMLANMVRAIFHSLPQAMAGIVLQVEEFSGPGNLPDPTVTDRLRYRQNFSIELFYSTILDS